MMSDLSPDHRNGFTFLRLMSALLVMFTHSYVVLGRGPDPLAKSVHLLALSTIGIDSFFVISGFLVCGSLQRNRSLLAFARNRFLRIVPGLAAVVLVSVFLVGPLLSTAPDYWHNPVTYDYLLNATVYAYQEFLPGVFGSNPVHVVNGSLWTLIIEVGCYGMLAAIAWCGALRWRSFAVLIAVLLALHIGEAFPRLVYLFRMELFQLDRFAALFCGGALLSLLPQRVRRSGKLAIVAFLLILLGGWLGQRDWHYFSFIYLLLWPFVLVNLAFALKPLHWMNKFDISYGFYLYGFLIQQCCVLALGSQIGPRSLTAIVVPIDLVCASLSWVLIERPALRLKQRGP